MSPLAHPQTGGRRCELNLHPTDFGDAPPSRVAPTNGRSFLPRWRLRQIKGGIMQELLRSPVSPGPGRRTRRHFGSGAIPGSYASSHPVGTIPRWKIGFRRLKRLFAQPKSHQFWSQIASPASSSPIGRRSRGRPSQVHSWSQCPIRKPQRFRRRQLPSIPSRPHRSPFLPSSLQAPTTYASLAYTRKRASEWQASLIVAGALGHINSASGLGDWPQGRAHLEACCAGLPHGQLGPQ
jgi:hypothetical protein